MTLQLRYKGSTNVPVEVEGITPCSLRDKTLAEIEQCTVFHGNEKVPLAEFFDISGNASNEQMEWQGDLSGVHWIGAKMLRGKISIHGNGGRHIGSELQGGEIDVRGNAGDWVGAEMHGGTIHVHGNAGHLIGAAYRGSARGMTGGRILIDGNVGNEIGHTMRRGLLVVGGNAGDLAAFNMLAGTILIFGEAGIRHGAGMRRGTLGFFGDNSPPLLPSFQHACRYQPEFVPLLFQQLKCHDFVVPEHLFTTEFNLYHGDLIEGGRGEILTVAA